MALDTSDWDSQEQRTRHIELIVKTQKPHHGTPELIIKTIATVPAVDRRRVAPG
jgi:hypothetical protein